MNKNKLIFAIIWAVFLVFILFVAATLKNSWNNNNENQTASAFNIWVVGDEVWKARDFVEGFKKVYPEYKSKIINIESFSDYDDYSYALTAAIAADKAPDIFVLNNNERDSAFSSQVLWIDPSVINPNDFRKKYKWVFADDLILRSGEWENIKEFLAWVPVWYETLGIFYNRRYVKNSDLESLSWLNNIVSELKAKKKNIVPIWIWNGSTVPYAWDIVAQFFMLEDGVSWLSDITWAKLKQGLASYLLYWDTDWYNQYDSRFMELSNMWQNSIDLFSRWETFMVVWYPSLIKEIDEKWFSKNFLLASAFPHYYSWAGKTLVNYNYFVMNRDSQNTELANKFLSYLSSDIWALSYLEKFSYYLPALLSLESDKLDKKIDAKYNIALKDFYSEDYELSSFDKWIKNIYDREINSILDNSTNSVSSFEKFRTSIICKANKISTLENLSKSCD